MKVFLTFFRWIFHYSLRYNEYKASNHSFFSIKEVNYDQSKKDKDLTQSWLQPCFHF